MFSTLLGIPLSLLPRFYQRRWLTRTSANLDAGALLSGLIQCGLCSWFFFHPYFQYLAVSKNAPPEVDAMYGVGFVSVLDFLFHPLPLVLAYFAVEGLTRFAVAFLTSDRMGTLPLALVAQAQRGLTFAVNEFRLGKRILDEVAHGDGGEYDLRIASCRPKEQWTEMITVSYEDVFYEVIGEKRGPQPRQFVYLLRQKSPVKVIRGICLYSPDDPLPGWKRNRLRQRTERMRTLAARAR